MEYLNQFRKLFGQTLNETVTIVEHRKTLAPTLHQERRQDHTITALHCNHARRLGQSGLARKTDVCRRLLLGVQALHLRILVSKVVLAGSRAL